VRVDESRRALNPGLLRHQIRWERKVVAGQDGFGQDDFTWTLVVLVKAQLVALQGRELETAQQRWAEARYRIRQHYVPGMDRAERGVVKIDGEERYLDIVDVQDLTGTGREQVIIAKEWAA
jgi:head-tail adaptor